MSNYNYLEAGKTGYTQKSLEMIAKSLEVSPADLLSKNPMEEMPEPMERDLWDDLYEVFLELNPDNQQMTYKIASMFKSHQQKRIMARLRFAKEEQGPTD